MHREDDKFDIMIKSILDEGSEEVPSRIWESISSRLDEAAAPVTNVRKRHVIPVWLRNTGIGFAAAAAIVSVVIFRGTSGSEQSAPAAYQDNTLAVIDNTHAVIQEENESDKDITKDIFTPADASSEAIKKLTAYNTQHTEPITADAISEDSQSNNTQKNIADKNSKSDKTNIVKEHENSEWRDPFVEFAEPETKKRNKVKAAVTLFGNAISNSNAERQKDLAFMAPGIPKESKVTESSDSKFGIPLSFGIGAKLSFTPHWSMSIGLNYSHLSRTFDGNFYDVKEDGSYTNTHYTDISNTQNYIGIPINIYYSILHGDFVDFYAYAGGSAEYCLSNKYVMPGTNGTISHNGSAGSFQFSANAGIGVEFIIADRFGIYIDPSVRYYFSNSKTPKSIRTEQPLMIGFEAGLRFRF